VKRFIKIKDDFINVNHIISIEKREDSKSYKMYCVHNNYYDVPKEEVPSMLSQIEEIEKETNFVLPYTYDEEEEEY